MAARRVDMDKLVELVRLHRMGTGTREVARLLGISPNTERVYREALQRAQLLAGSVEQLPTLEELKAAVLAERPRPELPAQQRSHITPWREQVEHLLDKGLGPKVVWQRLREQESSFDGTYPQVKRLCRRLRADKGVDPMKVAIPVETKPGEVAQVDFGFVGWLYDPARGCLRRAWCFLMVLGFSRHMVARIVFDQRVETWLRLHVECFEELGGVPEVIVPDNLKAAVIRAAFGVSEPTALNRSYRELARHYGFKVDPTPPRAPNKKGKVESGIKYIKRSFFKGREEQDVAEVRRMMGTWLQETAGLRIHGTTGQQPRLVFEQHERTHLRSLPPVPFEPVLWKEAKVHQDSHIAFERRLYSVPWRLVGSKVWVRATSSTIVVYADDERVATHSRRGHQRRSTIEVHLPEGRRQWRHRSRDHWETAARTIGPEVEQLIVEIFEADDVLYQLRVVQAVMRLLEGYPPHRARAACARASFYGITSYQGVKRILVNALDLEPLPNAVNTSCGPLESPRYARNIPELVAHSAMEAPDEPH
jgi:transposase